MKIIDMKLWPRREHFEFFRKYDNPFWGLTTDIDCTLAYETAKSSGESFFLVYLHKTLQAINEIEAFRYRILNERVVCYDKINVSSTAGRKDGTFAFTAIDYDENFETFKLAAQKELKAVQNSSGLRLSENAQRLDTVHFTAIPWVKFSAISHPGNFNDNNSIPKISFGQMTIVNHKKIMPVALHAHHGLADGYHAGLFFDRLQKLMNSIGV